MNRPRAIADASLRAAGARFPASQTGAVLNQTAQAKPAPEIEQCCNAGMLRHLQTSISTLYMMKFAKMHAGAQSGRDPRPKSAGRPPQPNV